MKIRKKPGRHGLAHAHAVGSKRERDGQKFDNRYEGKTLPYEKMTGNALDAQKGQHYEADLRGERHDKTLEYCLFFPAIAVNALPYLFNRQYDSGGDPFFDNPADRPCNALGERKEKNGDDEKVEKCYGVFPSPGK